MDAREVAARGFRSLTRPSNYPITEALFIRLLGLTYIAAFGSLLPQVKPLFGSHGIVPVAQMLADVHREFGREAYVAMPTLLWFGVPDTALTSICYAGCISGICIAAGLFSRVATLIAWIFYLSLVSVGAPFMNFQWDALLLECGFLALFAGSPALVWVYRFLLFRLMVESGLVKLTSGDLTWRGLTALRYHFMTQPLPTPLAWYAFHLPARVLDLFTGMTLIVELATPFLLFGSRRLRQLSAAVLLVLQLTILLTGNYGFFNLLTMALCLWGLDDRAFAPLHKLLRVRPASERLGPLRAVGSGALAILIVLGGSQLLQMTPGFGPLPLFNQTMRAIAPFEIVNTYGLFAVMTTARSEIVLQGSEDGDHWQDYEFPYKPGETHRALPVVAPYMPRLDWQMWFAALGTFNENRWVGNLMYRLLTGDDVRKLFLAQPEWKKSRYMRAELYDYTFTTPAERERTGAIWKRDLRGDWFGPVSLTGR